MDATKALSIDKTFAAAESTENGMDSALTVHDTQDVNSAVTASSLKAANSGEDESEVVLATLSSVEELCKAITDKPEIGDEGCGPFEPSISCKDGIGMVYNQVFQDCEKNGSKTNNEEKATTNSSPNIQPTDGIKHSVDHPVRSLESKESVSEPSSSVSKLRCPKCSYVTRNKVLFDNHTCDNQDEDNDLEEQTKITLQVDAEKKYNCSECNFAAQGHAFEEHLMCHIILRPYQCLYCSECFVNRRDIGRHVVFQHQGMKMNCALRALKRAKGLMKAALASGTYVFYARVAGKVPLTHDPEKSKLSKSEKAKLKKSLAEATGKSSDCAVADKVHRYQKPESEIAQSTTSSAGTNESVSLPVVPSKPASSEMSTVENTSIMATSSESSNMPAADSKTAGSSEVHGAPEEPTLTVNKDTSKVQVHSEHCDKSSAAEVMDETRNSGFSSAGLSGTSCSQEAASTDNIAKPVGDASTNFSEEEDDVKQLDMQQLNSQTKFSVETSVEECSESGKKQVMSPDKQQSIEAQGKGTDDNMEDSLNQHEENMETNRSEADLEQKGHEIVHTVDGESCSANETLTEEAMEEENHANASKPQFPESNFDQSQEEQSLGFKIVAAFSLQDEHSKDSTSGSPAASGSDGKGERTQDTTFSEKNQEKYEAASTEALDQEQEALRLSTKAILGPPSTEPLSTSSFLGPLLSTPLGTTYCTTVHGSIEMTPCTMPGKNYHFFLCGFGCNFSSLTSVEFRDHLVVDHAGEVSFSCYHCGFQSHSEDGLVRHISAHAHMYSKSAPLYICGASACKFGSNLVADFMTHISSWHPDLTSFRCHDCDEQFWSLQELLQHFDCNFLHVINCPHCTAKSTERKTLLKHMAAAHPGKPKMVSVAKQIICRDRKINNYAKYMEHRDCLAATAAEEAVNLPTALIPEAVLKEASSAIIPNISSSRNKSLVSILTEPIQPKERALTRGAAIALPESDMKMEIIEEDDDDEEEDPLDFDAAGDDSADEEEFEMIKGQGTSGGDIAFLGSKADDRDAENFKCNFCTFIARDRCRLEGHEKCHGLPPSRKSRFKCMYCPQGFNNEHKFNSHVSCHPGLIKFNLYCCKRCEFDSNQRHIILRHIRSTRDQVHMSFGAQEEEMYAVMNKTMETRVLECTQCSYMTRHRKHLVQHIKREHASPRKTGITLDCDIVEKYPVQSANRNKALELALNHDQAGQLPVGDDGNVRENQARRFKCPICQYLVPRAADLKAHVKRHSEIGEITLVMFRCKYCSAASTAREIIYGHLMEKHLGKQIALVKRIVTIDTKGGDNGYAVTSMEDEEDGVVETPGTSASSEATQSSDKMVLLIPDAAGETFQSPMQCPCCSFASYMRKAIIQHVADHHPDVSIMGRRKENSEIYPLETSSTSSAVTIPAARITLGEALKGDILIVPDNQTFDEAVRCPKCEYATIHRRNIVQHLEKHHPDVSVMGRNDYPTFEGKSQGAAEANAMGKDGMVIIGSGSLDEKIRCLYENYGDKMKCMICQTERPKKFFIHVHILRHLNILLWKCMYCSHKGLQKYKMMDHIKKVHPGMAVCVRYLPVNVEEKVNEYLRNASVIRARRSGEDPVADAVSPAKTITSLESSCNSSFQLNLEDISDQGSSTSKGHLKPFHDNLSGCIIGSDDLDVKLACLYALGEGSRFRCVVCGQEFQRKFAVHRHIVQSHLKVNLLGCGYCDLKGVEKHIIMDHIIETHRHAPISIRNLAQDLEYKVSEFLSRMTLDADAALDLPPADIGMDDDFNFKLPEPPQLPTMLVPLEPASPARITSQRSSPSSSATSSSSSKNQLNPKLLLLGRDTLHHQLRNLLEEMQDGMRCLVCNWDFPRKYPAHRHILMKHLKVGIIGCPYCSFEGVERYQVFTHIKEDHKGAELSLRYLTINMEEIVSKFMADLASGSTSANSKTLPPWSVRKPVVLKTEVQSDTEDDLQPDHTPPSAGGGKGLVVAMFGRKNTPKIKEEPVDDEAEYGEDAEEGDSSMDVDEDHSDDLGQREVHTTSLLSANGTKAKSATDVLTSIKVITVKEKGFKRHICEKCKFTSLHRSNIVRHIYRVHEQYREQECPVCNYKTLSRVLMQQHLSNEHPGISFPATLARMAKRKHENKPEDMEYDSIKRCKAAASSRRRDSDLSPPVTSSSNTQLYACAYCSFETQTHAEIVQHTRDNHSLNDTMKNQGMGQNPRELEPEDTEFETLTSAVKMSQLDGVNGSEDTLTQCFYCTYKTGNEEDLKVHFMDSHPGLGFKSKKVPTWRFVCRTCNVKTRAHSKMRYHLNRHINYRPYTCTTCGMFFPSPDQCRKHCRANGHNETFTYVKIPRKEKRLQQLLKESQEIALTLSYGTSDPVAAASTSSSPSRQETPTPSRKAKKSFSSGLSKVKKSYEYDAPYSPRLSASKEERGKEEAAQMVCASCDFTAQNVCDVWLHFIEEHKSQEFQWMDLSTGHICTETGEITNAKVGAKLCIRNELLADVRVWLHLSGQ